MHYAFAFLSNPAPAMFDLIIPIIPISQKMMMLLIVAVNWCHTKLRRLELVHKAPQFSLTWNVMSFWILYIYSLPIYRSVTVFVISVLKFACVYIIVTIS